MANQFKFLIGIDEAGRGPLAGPVSVGLVLVPVNFDWNLIPESMRSKIILSGGLRVENVAQAVQQIKPWAVDVASGVEPIAGLKGIKDHVLIQRFVKATTETVASTEATTNGQL